MQEQTSGLSCECATSTESGWCHRPDEHTLTCVFSSCQVCDWLYPLMATDSPVLLCNTGVFMFPDMMAPAPGHYVGVVLSSELPAADLELFQDLLSQMTDLRVQVGPVCHKEIQ